MALDAAVFEIAAKKNFEGMPKHLSAGRGITHLKNSMLILIF